MDRLLLHTQLNKEIEIDDFCVFALDKEKSSGIIMGIDILITRALPRTIGFTVDKTIGQVKHGKEL